MATRAQETLARQWRLVQALQARRRGATQKVLTDELEISKATFYRYVAFLEEAGVPIVKENVNGEVRYRLETQPLPVLRPTAYQIYALHIARNLLAPLEGTRVLAEIDSLVQNTSNGARPAGGLSTAPAPKSGCPEITKQIEQAISSRKRMRIKYRKAEKSEPSWRVVDPVCLRFSDSHLYLIAWDLDRAAARTFKTSRMSWVELLDEEADDHPELVEKDLFSKSVKIWQGEPVYVAIRIAKEVAWMVDEWPLITEQTVEVEPTGSAIVRACVAGTKETKRWVLKWGSAAEVLEPWSLREEVTEELAGALKLYQRKRVLRISNRSAARRVGKQNGRKHS